MKKRLGVLLLVLLMVASLLGCAEQKTVYETDINGIHLQVDLEGKTVSDGEYTYRYSLSGGVSSYEVEITYPNGSSYWRRSREGNSYDGWSDRYAEDLYVSGDALVSVVEVAEGFGNESKGNFGKVFGCLLLIAFGIFEIVAPETSWHLSHGWRYQNAEPSDAALTVSRIGGGIILMTGIVILLFN